MSKRSAASLVFLVLVALAIAWVAWLPDGSSTDALEDKTTPTTHTGEEERQEPETREEGPSERQAETVETVKTPEGKPGRLVVMVQWHDGTPAPNVGVRCSGNYPKLLPGGRRLAVSDTDGIAIFDGLGPRKVSLSSNRGGRAKAEVFADRESKVTLEVAKGIDIDGVVVDTNGARVAGADVWLTTGFSDWLGGRVVGRSDADGKFEIRSAKKGQSVGAIKEGYERSKFVDLDTQDTSKSPVQVRLQLERGGASVRVRVFDKKQEPAAGALVAIGLMPRSFRQRSGMAQVESWTPRVVECDANGEALAHGFPAGVHPIAIRHRGHPIWNGEVETVAGRTTECIARLLAPVVVHGVAKDEGDKPLEGVIVRAVPSEFDEVYLQSGQFDFKAVLGYPMTTTDSKGAYRLETVAPGQVWLHAQTPRKGRMSEATYRTKKSLRAQPGTTFEWNPLLSPGHTIEGQVVHRCGTAMGNVFVTAKEQKTGKRNVIYASREGRFRFVNLEPVAYTVSVQLWSPPEGSKPLFQNDVWPDQAKLRLAADFDAPVQLPPGSVRGRIQDNAQRIENPSSLLVMLVSDKNFWNTARDLKDGKFHFKNVRPGRYKISAKSGENLICIGDWFEVTSKNERDVGVIWTDPKGSVLFRIERTPGTETLQPTISMTPKDSIHGTRMEIGTRNVVRNDNVSVGSYRTRVYGTGILTQTIQVDVTASGLVEVPIKLETARLTKLRVNYPTGATDGQLDVWIENGNGKKVVNRTITNFAGKPSPFETSYRLRPGRYTIHAKTSSGLTGRADFEVTLGGQEKPLAEVTLKS